MGSKAGLFGQHLIADGALARLLVKKAEIGPEETVLEIGAGDGAITRRLCQKAKKVVSFEIDPEICAALQKDRPENLELIIGDAFSELKEKKERKFDRFVANPPFDSASGILELLPRLGVRGGAVILPLTLGKKLVEEGVFFQSFYGNLETEEVSPQAFSPEPKTRTVILSFSEKASLGKKEVVARELFLQKDKELKNALREALIRAEGISKREAKGRVSALGLSEELLGKKVGSIPEKEIGELVGNLFPKNS